jgi:integrase
MAVRKHMLEKGTGIEVMPRSILLNKIREIKSPRIQALACFLYLSACRVEEVVKLVQETKLNRTIIQKEMVDGVMKKTPVAAPITERKLKGEPIKKSQIEIREDVILVHNVRCLKKRKGYKLRTIPININSMERPFIETFLEYLENVPDNGYLFDMTRQNAFTMLDRVGLYCHFLRHCRLTHLAVDYNFNSSELRQFTGWGSSFMSDHYVHLNIDNLMNKMSKNGNPQ